VLRTLGVQNLSRDSDTIGETIHPVVRTDATDCERLSQLYNSCLGNDGYQIVEKTRISGKAVYAGRFVGTSVSPGINSAKESLSGTDVGYVSQ